MDKKLEAVLELRRQQDKLISIHPIEFQTWIITTTEIIRTYFGEESGFYTMLKDFDFNAKFNETSTPEQNIAVNTYKVHDILVSSMEYLDKFGVYKKPTENPMSKIKANWFVALVFTGIPTLICVGWSVANLKNDAETKNMKNSIIQMQTKINELRDSILLHTPSNSIPDEKPEAPSK